MFVTLTFCVLWAPLQSQMTRKITPVPTPKARRSQTLETAGSFGLSRTARGNTALKRESEIDCLMKGNIMFKPNNQKPHVSPLYKFMVEDWQQQAEELAAAVSTDPDNVILHNQLAWLYVQLEWFDRAIHEFDEILRLDSLSDFVYTFRGLIRGYQDDYAGAFADFKRCLEIRPNFPPAYVNRGRVRAMMSDWEGAIEDFTSVIAIADHQTPRWYRAEAYSKIGRKAEAFADFEVAINEAQHEGARQQLWQEVYRSGLLD